MPAKKKSRWVSRAVHDRVVDTLDKFAARMVQEKHDMRRDTDDLMVSANNAFANSNARKAAYEKARLKADRTKATELEARARAGAVEGERLVRLITVAAAALDVIDHEAVVGDANLFTVIAARNALAAALGPHQKRGSNGNLTPAGMLEALQSVYAARAAGRVT